jgi:hypothetical protein
VRVGDYDDALFADMDKLNEKIKTEEPEPTAHGKCRKTFYSLIPAQATT